MSFEKVFKQIGEEPFFVRGTCIEEALFLLKINRIAYKTKPSEIYAFPVYESFKKLQIKSKLKIPQYYNINRIRDEATAWALSNNGDGSSLFVYGDRDHFEEFLKQGRMGVVIYLSKRIFELSYEQDDFRVDRSKELNAVKIPLDERFNPECVLLVEPNGPMEHRILKDRLPKRIPLLDYRFNDFDEANDWESEADTTEPFDFP